MIKTLPLILSACTLSACAPPQVVYRQMPVPEGLTAPVAHPLTPNAQTATQRDVALYLIQQRQAIDLCNAQLHTIKQWSHTWTTPTAHKSL